ncbi:hypothetical protein [Virgibacillus sediminis]|uniref:Uncharacterized protein n=1 Tax=Virgibacillus sediminis TaxID=202260 RepID=A0ABV7A1U3_9BACI
MISFGTLMVTIQSSHKK